MPRAAQPERGNRAASRQGFSLNATQSFEAYEGNGPFAFVSYAHADAALVHPELERLRELGLNIWYDQGLSPGSRWSDELARRIRDCQLFIFFVTPNSAASVHCQDEASFALDRDKPFLAIHLTETPLPPGLELRLGTRQAILKHELTLDQYQRKLATAVSQGGLSAQPGSTARSPAPAPEVPAPASRRPALIGVAALLAVALLAVWFARRPQPETAPTVAEAPPQTRVAWARDVAAPEIERLIADREIVSAFVLAREALEALPDDPKLKALAAETVVPEEVTSDPLGALVSVKSYDDPDGDWQPIGRTPFTGPPATDLRWRFEKEGYVPREVALFWAGGVEVKLYREGDSPPEMVPVPGGLAKVSDESGHAGPEMMLEDFWIDQSEVTNTAYRAFLNSQAYASAESWEVWLKEVGNSEDPQAVVARFVDSTGQPGPATWSLSSYPDGQGDHPVEGISWVEAAAYCAFAGKSLPTVFHYSKAAQEELLAVRFFIGELVLSNFDLDGTQPIGDTGALGPYGTYDLLGNVKEWAYNPDGIGRRYLSGAGYGDPAYLSRAVGDQLDPLLRPAATGTRCVRDPAEQDLASLQTAVELTSRSPVALEPANDTLYESLSAQYDFTPTPLNPELGETVSTSPYWRRQVATIDTAYGERMDVLLYLPNEASPPYQSVVFFPGSAAHMYGQVGGAGESSWQYFIPRSGRALVIPMYSGLYNRRAPYPRPDSRAKIELVIRWAQDLTRAVDYLQTREDIAGDKLAFYGFSLGGTYGPVFTALEQRFKASVYISGGTNRRVPDEHWPAYFAPRVKVPTLMIAGRYDSQSPLETYQEPLLALLGTPPEDRKIWVFEGGHAPTDWNATVGAMLDWFDRYLGKPARN